MKSVSRYSLPLVHRCLAWVLLPAQILASPLVLVAAETSTPVPASSSNSTNPAATPPPEVKVNRTAPKVAPPSSSLHFSAAPTSEEISHSRALAQTLVPAGQVSDQENAALARALQAFAKRVESDDFSALTEFLQAHPKSPWRASLLLNLGLNYYHAGYFSQALTTWEDAWNAGKAEPSLKAVADEAVGQLARMNARIGRADRLESIFTELKGRKVTGAATEELAGAKEGLWLMRNKPDEAFRCGSMALDRIRASENVMKAFDPKIDQARSTPNGMSLTYVNELADSLGMKYQKAFRTGDAPVIIPAVVNWKVGHYAAIIKEQNGRYLIQDPTFRDNLWITRKALNAETSGYYLVPQGTLPQGWRTVDATEGGNVWGKGSTGGNDPNRYKCSDDKTSSDCGCSGMAVYNMHTMLVSLNINDAPLFYHTPRGGDMSFTVTYNQRDTNQPATFDYSNLGSKWTLNQLAYVTDDPDFLYDDVTLYLQGGGVETYTNFNATTQSFDPQPGSHAVLVRTSATGYERRMADGSKEEYTIATPIIGYGRNVFLNQIIDRTGQTVLSVAYDANFRITSVTDALGQVNTFAYTFAGDIWKITKITDPFGRFAMFDYDVNGELSKITDMIGMTSQFTYDGSFINSMTTPYGTTRFAYGDVTTDPTLPTSMRWLEVTDPMGGKERLEYRHDAPGIAGSDDPATVPAGIAIENILLNFRNSFYWDKKAMMMAPGDYTQTKITHWLHTADGNSAAGVKESEKQPLENRIWYTYAGQPNSYFVGTSEQPIAKAQVLGDLSTQLYQWQYNDAGNITQRIDPVGRTLSFTYDATGIDLLEVRNITNGLNDLIQSFAYTDGTHPTSIHQPLTVTDAAGQTTALTYNGNGQILTSTITRNGVNETTTNVYDANGYLQSVTLPYAGAMTSYAYDGFGRTHTVIDSEGAVFTYDYDGLNRVTKTTFPDGSFERTIYHWLDAEWKQDRLGRWTHYLHDALKRTTEVDDPAGHTIKYDWCVCGALHGLTDGEGHTTRFAYDIEKRLVQRTFDDGSALQYLYSQADGRLLQGTDAKGQVTHYVYNVDDTLQSVSYTDASGNPLTPATPGVSYAYDPNYQRVTTITDATGQTTFSYYPTGTGTLGGGKISSITGPLANSVLSYTYDELGRIVSRSINGVSNQMQLDSLGRMTSAVNPLGTFGYSYLNATSHRTTMTYPGQQVAQYAYWPIAAAAGTGNGNERLRTITNALSDGATPPNLMTISKFDYAYDSAGEILTWTQQTDANPAMAYGFSYDGASELLNVTKTPAAGGTVQKQFTYGYDQAGNRTSEQIDNTVAGASYNALNQLTQLTGSGPMTFEGTVNKPATVTVGGNRATVDASNHFRGSAVVSPGPQSVEIKATDAAGSTVVQHAQVNVVSGSTGQTLSYDLNGNLTNDGARTFTWDARDHVTSITTGVGLTEFVYNWAGQRVAEKLNGTVVKQWVWDGTNLCEERDASNNVTKRFYDQGEQIAGTSYYFTRDHLGSVREMTDAAGAIRARYDYDPYGRKTKVSGDLEADFGYTGHYFHPISGLFLTYFRAYDPNLGRWLSRDPIAEAGGINLYDYVLNDPVDHTDSLGLIVVPPNSQSGPPGNAAAACDCKKSGGRWQPYWQIHGYTSANACANAELRKALEDWPDVVELGARIMFVAWAARWEICNRWSCNPKFKTGGGSAVGDGLR